MQCPEQLLGPELYFTILALVVGVLMNGVKRIPWLSSDAVPVLAFMIGWVLDAASSNLACGMGYVDAALSGLGGGLAGLAAAGGHEALMRTASVFGLGGLATKLLGKAKKQQDKRKGSKTKSAALIVLGVVSLSGCAGMLPAIAKLAQGSQYLGTVIDVATAGAETYFARHPNLEAERRVEASVTRARSALAALDAALATVEAVDSQNLKQARTEALKAYTELRALLTDLGVLTATPPAGGVETDAPEPVPIALPTPEMIAGVL